jgi:hypothetical protein
MPEYLIARIAVTLAALMITGAPLLADLNKTHATNPLWTPHARFHVVWQVLSYGCLGVISLFLIWSAGPLVLERLYLACLLLGAIIVGFFLAAVSVRRFGGSFYDKNGYPPFATRQVLGKQVEFDVNATGFTVFALILAVATISVWLT